VKAGKSWQILPKKRPIARRHPRFRLDRHEAAIHEKNLPVRGELTSHEAG